MVVSFLHVRTNAPEFKSEEIKKLHSNDTKTSYFVLAETQSPAPRRPCPPGLGSGHLRAAARRTSQRWSSIGRLVVVMCPNMPETPGMRHHGTRTGHHAASKTNDELIRCQRQCRFWDPNFVDDISKILKRHRWLGSFLGLEAGAGRAELEPTQTHTRRRPTGPSSP